MGTIILFGLLVGLDNFQIAAGLGATQMCRRQRLALVCAFAFFEALMPLVGLMMGPYLTTGLASRFEFLPPLSIALCGVAIIWQTLPWRDNTDVALWTKHSFLALPVLLSLDNLFAGAGLGALGCPVVATSLIVGLCSGSLCFAGLMIGDRIRGWFPKQANIAAGAWLLCVAGFAGFIN